MTSATYFMDASSRESVHGSASFPLVELRIHRRGKLKARVCAQRLVGGDNTPRRTPLRMGYLHGGKAGRVRYDAATLDS